MSEEDDAGMASAFADFVAAREAMDILSRYTKGYQVVLVRGWNETLEEPTYQVVISKMNGDKPITSGGLIRDWQAEGMSGTFLLAVKAAAKLAKQHLKDDEEARNSL